MLCIILNNLKKYVVRYKNNEPRCFHFNLVPLPQGWFRHSSPAYIKTINWVLFFS
jgi:hypothetical protein